MDLYSRIELIYQPIFTEFLNLTKEEWTEMIRNFIIKLASKRIGNLLLDHITDFLCRGYKLTITNVDRHTMIYPKIKYISSTHSLIVIPSVPYFTTVDILSKITLNPREEYEKDFLNLHTVSKYGLSQFPLGLQHIDSALITRVRMPGFIGLAHELVHCARHFNRYSDDSREEDNTIYGIYGSTLQIDGVNITENAIRGEWGYGARISHEAYNIFCYGVRSTYHNSSMFTKNDFFN